MAWVFMEVLIVLFLLIGIVWWTLPRKRDEQERHGGNEQNDDGSP